MVHSNTSGFLSRNSKGGKTISKLWGGEMATRVRGLNRGIWRVRCNGFFIGIDILEDGLLNAGNGV